MTPRHSMTRTLTALGILCIATLFSPAALAQSDDCATATSIGTGDVDFAYDTTPFTTSPEPVPTSCPANGQIAIGYTHDLWVTYTADKTTTSFFLDGTVGDPIFAVYDSCANATAGVALDCEDRGFDGGFAISTVVGATYIIRIGADNNATVIPGPGVLEIRAIDPAANDECLTATPVSTGVHSATIIGASTSADPNPAPCPSQPATSDTYQNDIWFSWVADNPTAFVSWRGFSPLTNPIIAIYNDCASATAGDAIDCDDRGNPNYLRFSASVGATYFIRVGNDGSAVGFGELSILSSPPLSNDECGGAIPLTTFTPQPVDLFAGTTGLDPNPAPCPNQPTLTDNYEDDLWYSWVADNPFAYIEWLGEAPLTNPITAVYGSCASAAAGIAFDCEDRGNPNFLNLPVTIGATYLIRVASDTTFGATGLGTLLVESYPPAVNDECATPLFIGSGDVTTLVPTFGATSSADPVPQLCASGGQIAFFYQQDVWLSWTATSGAARFDFLNTGDPVFAVYEDCATAATGNPIDCEDRGTIGSLQIETVPGQTYLIRIGHGFVIGGVGELIITALQGPVRNLSCSVAGDNYTLSWDNPANTVIGDPITITSTEPGVANPIAMLTATGASETFPSSLLPANQGLPTNAVFAVTYDGTLGTSATKECPASFNPVPGQECVAADPIGMGDVTIFFNNSLATDSPEPDPVACPSNGQIAFNYTNDLWFEWIADKPVTFLEVQGNSGVPVYAIYASCADAAVGNAIDCEDRGLQGGFSIETIVGATYFIRVASDNGIGPGPGALTLTGFDLALNDECTTATAIGSGALVTPFSTLGASASLEPVPSGPCPSTFFFLPGSFPADVWFTWQSTGGLAFISARGLTGVTDPVLAVYDSCGDAAVGIAIDCVNRGNPAGLLVGPLAAGETLLIRVSHEDSTVGTGELEIAEFPISGTNDECATATALGAGDQVVRFETVSATASVEPLPVGPCPSTTILPTAFPADVWYTWESSGGLAYFSVEGLAGITDPVIALYESCALATAGIALDCEDRGDPSSILFGPLNAGQTYVLRLSHELSAPGVGELIIEEILAVPNDECLTTTDLGTGNVTLEVDLRGSTGSIEPDPNANSCQGDQFTAGNYDPDIWFRWTAHTEDVRISFVQKQPATVTDPVFAIYRSCLDAAAGIFLDCQDNGATNNELILALSIGDTYIVRLADDGGAVGGRGTLTIASVQDNVMNLTCNNTIPTANYSLSWLNPTNGGAGDTIEISSDEPGLVNPLLYVLPWPMTSTPLDTLLPGNQGIASFPVTFSVRYVSATLGASVDDETCTIVFDPQPGETCALRTSLGTGDLSFAYDTTTFVGSGDPVPNSCPSNGQFAFGYGIDRWFSWTASGELTEFDVTATVGDPLFAVYASCADAAAGIAIDCENRGLSGSFSIATVIGQQYVVRVGNELDGGVAMPGPAVLTITTQAPPVTNLTCAAAPADTTTLSWTNPVSGGPGDSIVVSSDEPGVTNPVATLPSPATSTPYTLLPANQGLGLAVTISVSYVSSLGSSDDVDCTVVFNPIANDECLTATTLSGPLLLVSTTDLAAATESPEPDVSSATCGAATNFDQDGWYQWTATTPEIEIAWRSTDMDDPVLALYASCADAAAGNAIACDDGGTGEAEINASVVVGNTYLIRVGDDDSPMLGVGELTIDAQCLDLEGFTADFDCVNEIVTLAWIDGDAYTSLSLTANGVPTLQQPIPFGVGASNGIIIFNPPLNTDVIYELTALCANGGVSVASATVSSTTPTGAEALVIQLEQPSLVDSGAAIASALQNNGVTATMIRDQNNACLGEFITDAESIWVVEGTFPDNQAVQGQLANALFNAVENGKNVYLEGSDHWGFALQLSLYDQVDGVDSSAVLDGDDTLTTIAAVNAVNIGLLPGSIFSSPVAYTQDQTGNDSNDQLALATPAIDSGITDAEVIFRNAPQGLETDYVVGIVAHTSSGQTTIACSFEFGGFGFAGNRDLLMSLYLAEFGSGFVFQRGDCNNDGSKNIADPIRLLSFLFPAIPPSIPLDCDSACDGNDDGALNIADAVAMLNVLFPVGPPVGWLPPDACGIDPTPGLLGCMGYTNCP
ncbi:MAG: hypothetical protein AAF581_14225 [Planctomycetota bacterium]